MCQIDDELMIHDPLVDEEAFRDYLDGLLALPFETEKILREMEQEKKRL